MILEEGQQTFASPGEALAHFGVRGMRWGFRKSREHIPEFESFGKPYDSATGLGRGINDLTLKKTKDLRVDNSEGFANVRSSRGFKSKQAKENYESVVSEFKALRDQYPEVAKLKVEVVPMSHLSTPTSRGIQAGVMHVHSGEVMIGYNDNVKEFSERKLQSWTKWVPGMAYPGYAGRHEMGHVLASAKGHIPPGAHVYEQKNLSKQLESSFAYSNMLDDRHKVTISKHGLSFDELGKLGGYAKTSPSEAYAEAFGQYHTPELRAKMSPELQRKIKAMLDDTGGK